MHFEHLIIINDSSTPDNHVLAHQQLWRGLVLRAEAPGLFVPWLDQCKIMCREKNTITRQLQYGDIVIDDKVIFLPQHQICYEIPAQNEIPASRLSITIEGPSDDVKVVRFRYEDSVEENAGSVDAFYNEFKHSAYQESDIDTIKLIRQFANEQKLDKPSSYESS
jgi:hypothetical protein